MLNSSIRYQDHTLFCDGVPLKDIVAITGTPVYIYSFKRVLENYERIRTAFAALKPHIHYSAKANANLSLLKTLIQAGAGIDAVSAGEIHRALQAGAAPDSIVFAGVGKTPNELAYALEQGIGWINVENIGELQLINEITKALHREPAQVALRFNPDITANTHPHIATGHGGAKFGLTAETIRDILENQERYPHVHLAGIHLHIGSQLHDTDATRQAVQAALDLIAPHPAIRTVNIGGGLPVAYRPDDTLPSLGQFAETLTPLLKDYTVMLEPGRSIVADAGLLVVSIIYVKKQAGQAFLITDGSMTELIRPALYQAHHEIVPVMTGSHEHKPLSPVNVVGPVCETTDVLGKQVSLPEMFPGELLAILTAGAYGMVMASNYNARPRPPEAAVLPDGRTWRMIRRRETWDDLLAQDEMV
ncbi:MAG: diaminopimelate decarboxylase [Anaerolineaceae bacterium]|nr:diaminopimelate decarboxylase [Anaerolineaceae bacterium]